jgi:hypothetical protein
MSKFRDSIVITSKCDIRNPNAGANILQDTSALGITRSDWPEPRAADERELVLAAQSDPEAFGALHVKTRR